jgi:hypothetical protein
MGRRNKNATTTPQSTAGVPIGELLGHDGQTLPVNVCPTCGYEMEAATSLKDKSDRPEPGSFTLCLKCGEIFVFTDALTLRLVELNDLVGVDKETGDLLTLAQRIIRRERFVP